MKIDSGEVKIVVSETEGEMLSEVANTLYAADAISLIIEKTRTECENPNCGLKVLCEAVIQVEEVPPMTQGCEPEELKIPVTKGSIYCDQEVCNQEGLPAIAAQNIEKAIHLSIDTVKTADASVHELQNEATNQIEAINAALTMAKISTRNEVYEPVRAQLFE